MKKSLLLIPFVNFCIVNAVNAENLILNGDIATDNRKTNIIELEGSAKAKKDNKFLEADKMIYNKDSEKLKAIGNVKYINIDDESVTTSDVFETDKKFDFSYATNVKQSLKDEIYISASTATIDSNDYTIAQNASYTSCMVNQNGNPTWLLKAKSVERDKEQQIIKFKHTWLELHGLPIYYWPYMEQPDINVVALSGWLVPSFGASSNIGWFISNSYYKYISPNEDMTFTPTVTLRKTATLGVEHRKVSSNSSLKTNLSISRIKNSTSVNEYQGHILSSYKFNSKNMWQFGGNLELTTNRNYTKKYTYLNMQGKDYFKNNVYATKTTKSSFLNIESASYRDIRKDPTPNVLLLPKITYKKQYELGYNKGFINLESTTNSIKLVNKTKMNSTSNTISYTIPKIFDNGLKLETSTYLRGDMYHYKYDNEQIINNIKYKSGSYNRLTPSASTVLSYPLIANNGEKQYLIEPIFGVFVSKLQKNPDYLPNNDSVDFELDESNLFSNNRYAGTDKIDTGQRIAYGARLKSWQENSSLLAFLGQSYNKDAQKSYSNYIGNIIYNHQQLSLSSMFELDSKSFEVRKMEASIKYSMDKLSTENSYTKINPTKNSNLKQLSQLKSDIIYEINRNWSSSAGFTYNFKGKIKKFLKQEIGFIHTTDCDCLKTKVSYTRDFSSDPNNPEKSIYLNLTFKALGQVTTSKSINNK